MVGAVVLETLVSIKEEEVTSMEVDDILVEALVHETLVKTEVEEAAMEEGVTGAVEVDSSRNSTRAIIIIKPHEPFILIHLSFS